MNPKYQSDLIAIIGIGCRFPEANDHNQFWQNLEQGINSISEIPSQRWEVEKYYSETPETPNKTISKWAGLIEGVDQFDAQFFGISPREATRMDPQQRIMLELSWSCIEDAGYSPLELSGSQVGVFIGSCNYDYNELQHQNENIEGHTATGSYTCIIPNRISYFFNFHGPSLPVDTACSSSLVALHQAVNSIKEKECEMALVGGISVLCTPTSYISFSQLGMLSPNGQCKTFDSEADGYVRGEGAGVVLLKPLAKALSDGDRIYGVIKGSAINHGGKARTLTSPNVYAQAQVLRAAYTNANIAPNTVSYIETHGTGTPLGDPIEINGLKRGFKQLHQQYEVPLTEKPYCGLGAVKTNVGHLEAAAGMAGVIKVLLAMKHKKLPKLANFQKLNPRIKLKDSPFYIVSETKEWQQLQTEKGEIIPRRVGVSSFGFGGVNAHVVLEEPPEQVKSQKSKVDVLERPQQILTLSGQTGKALRVLATKYQTYLQSKTESSLQDICFSANTGRTHFTERLAIVAKSNSDLQQKLADFIQDNEINGVVRGKAESQDKEIAFLFTGQGSQYVDMGRQLYDTQPTFHKIIDQCNEILKEYLEVPLLDVLYPQDSQNSSSNLLDQTAYTQPALFAIEYALFKLWESWGVKPSVVMGHSVGEYIAATVAGIFSLEDGLKLIAERGRLMQQLPPGGEMVSVMASESQVIEAIGNYSSKVTIAAINGPESIVISGESEAIASICSKLEVMGVKTKQLQVSHAFHSPLMEPMLAEFETVAQEVIYSQPQIPLISNVTGQKASSEMTTAKYWVNHVRQPVKFAQSMITLNEQGYELFLEIGPKPILLGMGRQCLPEAIGIWLPSLRPGVDEWQQMLSSLGQLYVRGVKVYWSGFDSDYNRHKVALPTYPFQRERYWIDTSKNHYNNTVNGSSSLVVKLLNQSDIQGLSQEIKLDANLTEDEKSLLPKLVNILTNRHQIYLQLKENVVYDYYNSFTELSKGKLSQEKYQETKPLQFITFGILPEAIPGFSWVKIFIEPNQNLTYQTASLESQQELRKLCFAPVDFSSCKKVLDFGCGYGSDLITLAKSYPHLQLNGYTISREQAKFATNQVNSYQLQEQIQIFNRDSSKDEFPDNYNLIFGFEVAHHIKNKSLLFSNISRHLEEEGLLVMADFIANGDFDIDHEETSSYFITKQHWLEQLSPNHLQLISTIDISQEIANYLYDTEFEESLNDLNKKGYDENIKSAFKSYNQLGKLLRKGLASYVLLAAKKQEIIPEDKIYHLNQEKLNQLLSYSEVSEKQWIYELKWEHKTNKQRKLNLPSQPGVWLIFSNDNDTQQLQTFLEQKNKSCVIVSPGSSYKQLGNGYYQVNPTKLQEFKQLIRDVLSSQYQLEGVVHLWSINTSIENLETSQELGCASVLHLVQAMVSELRLIVPLWLVTQGTQNVDIEEENQQEIQVHQAPIWGLGRVIALEHPDLNCRRVDLDRTNISLGLEYLTKELLNPDGEDQIAIRKEKRYVARLVRRSHKSLEKKQQIALKTKVSYLVTGGLGALGLEVAQWMVKQGARHIVLNSRRNPSEIAHKTIQELQQTGAKISVVLGDVSKEEDVANILKQIQESQPPLRGVIHAAGVLDDGVLQNMTWERFDKVLAPKLQGAWHLHNLTQKLPLEFFVCFSSITSLLGSSGQGNYAAANAFMDALAYHRQSIGLPGLTINWGAWEKRGMAVRLGNKHQSRLQTAGMSFISPEKGLQILGELLPDKVSQVGVFPINWSRFAKQLPGGVKMPCIEAFLSKQEPKETNSKYFLNQLVQAVENERKQILIYKLQTEVASILGLSKSKLPDPELGFFSLGIDSLMAVELRNLLSSTFNSSISTATLFETSNIKDLAEYLIKEIFPEEQDQEDVQDSQNINTPKKIETQFEGEIDSAIASELQEIQALLKEEP
ncbi:type I polyketide synthase [Moorena sp. SIO4G3]|uniref:type I polyketide synthase n=1 Tax=Moorena sp. SIO4G3 TaxID=2607821 RepID=UPI00142D16E0|nr:type I polyketide synthase [Moorena sp. SIO4G3]NEO77837.1 SDR family NAD(P)-dependent oxidoreductase [Moorena sp. SIO4G3]